MFRHRLVVTVLAAFSGSVPAAVVFVDDGNCPGPGAGTELDPYCSIQTAIDSAVDTDDIVVAPGTYFETVNFLGKAITLRSSDGPDVTIIDAQRTGTVVTCESGEGSDTVLEGFTITGGTGTDLPGDQPDMGLTGGGMLNHQSSPTVTDCTFTGNSALTGGGMYNTGSDPTVTDCVFLSNTAEGTFFNGGGMFNNGGSPAVTRCEFIANTRTGMGNRFSHPSVRDCIFTANTQYGGMVNTGGSPVITGCAFENNGEVGMSNRSGADPVIDRCTFVGHDARFGAAMVNLDVIPLVVACLFEDNRIGIVNEFSTPTLVDCTFNANGIGLDSRDSSLVVLGCAFTGNTVGGMVSKSLGGPGDLLVVDTSFVGNTSGQGGGAGMNNVFFTAPIVLRCVFVGNTGTVPNTGAGAIRNSAGTNVVIANCLFRDNSAVLRGGGVENSFANNVTIANCAFIGNTAQDGAAIHNHGSSPVVTNCTFVGNTAGSGGGALHNLTGGTGGKDPSTPILANCILWGNGPQEVFDDVGPKQSATTIRYSTVQGGWSGAGGNNIDTDPLFVDPTNGDFRLSPGSPCIDAGNNWGVSPDTADVDDDGDVRELTPLDLDGNPRFADDPATRDTGCGVNLSVDMGAYEFQGVPAPNPVYLGDLDADRVVGIIDLLGLLGDWGPCEPGCCLADLDLDGNVGRTDFMILLENWG